MRTCQPPLACPATGSPGQQREKVQAVHHTVGKEEKKDWPFLSTSLSLNKEAMINRTHTALEVEQSQSTVVVNREEEERKGMLQEEKKLMDLCLLSLVLLLLLLCLLPQSSSSSYLDPSVLRPDALCTNTTNITYPFGIRNMSDSLPGLEIDCDPGGGSPMLLFGSKKVEILEISVQEGYVRTLLSPVAFGYCSPRVLETMGPGVSLEGTSYTFSHTRNAYTVLGCDAMAIIQGPGGSSSHTASGCASFCINELSILDGSCSGVGCCQASIPPGLKSIDVNFSSIRNLTHSRIDNGSCSEAFLVEKDSFNFSAADLRTITGATTRPVVLDWAIGNETCEEVKRRNKSELVCKENSDCYNSTNGVGYRCNCSQGYAGNPYISGGCKDIDECSDKKLNNCAWKCTNNPGNFTCSCPIGYGKDGSGCKRDTMLEIALGIGLFVLVIILTGGFWMYCGLKTRKILKLKQKHFLQNGGLLLQQHINSREFSARIFTIEELERATDNFKEDNVVGRGGYGTVYRGILSDQQVVAIKKSKFVDESQIEHFINEVVILSKIHHRNVVKLLGCCLETQVPLLVYEFISNGTLFQHLHESSSDPSLMSWETRLRIAAETAGALAYLHCKASVPIIHRDVKSANILVDDNYTAKVADFGASRLVPLNQTHVTTLVQGTLGYLDPEYFHTSQLTEKSDVYSFGVVLLELLTSKKPISFCRAERERYIVAHFHTHLEEHQLLDLVDPRLVEEAGAMQLFAIAQVAKTCLSLKGEERPTMNEVALELNALSRLMKQHTELRKQEEGISSSRLGAERALSGSHYNVESHLLS